MDKRILKIGLLLVLYTFFWTGFKISVVNAQIKDDTLFVDFSNRVDASKFKFRYNSKFNLKYLDVEGGLSSSFITSLAEDKNGNIWIATWGGGLMKFDGRNIYTFNTHNGLPDNMVDVVYCDPEGTIWTVITGEVYYFDGNNFINVSNRTPLEEYNVIMLKQVRANEVWAFTEDSVAFSIKEKSNVFALDSLYDLPSDPRKYYEAECFKDSIYLATSDGIYRFREFQWADKKLDGNVVYDVNIISETNRIVHTSEQILHVLNGDTNQILAELNPKRVYEVIHDSIGNYWLVTISHGIVKYSPEETIAFADNNGLTNNIIWSSMIDSRGNVWLGTRAGGLDRYDNNLLHHYDEGDGLTGRVVWAITKDFNKDIAYLGILRGGVCVFKDGKITEAPFNAQPDFNYASVRSMHYDSHGNLWIGCTPGMFVYRPETGLKKLSGQNEVFKKSIFRIKEAKNGTVWIMGTGGTVCYHPDSAGFFRPFETDSLNENGCYDVCWDSRGYTWLARNNHAECVDQNEQPVFKDFTEATRHTICFNIMEDSAGNIWAGTRRGLYVLEGDPSGKIVHISEKEGLSNDIIWSTGIDNRGNIWAGTEFGLSKIHYEDSRMNSTDSMPKYTIEVFGMQEGFTGNDCTQNGLFIDDDGKFWWGTSKKLTIIDPELSYDEGTKPKVILTDISLHYQSLGLLDGYNHITDSSMLRNLGHSDNYLTFGFVGIDWGAESKLRYQYRLKGFKEAWSPYSTKNTVTYSNLDPGAYVLEIRAISNKGLESDILELPFQINPAFWQTIWFKLVVAVILVGGAFGIFRIRTANLRKRKYELEQTVRLRTLEINERNEELNQQNEEILAQRDEIERQKLIVENWNTEIKDSIIYAERIQNTILPQTDEFKSFFPESFIYYKPKDIVSGDFYWIGEKNGARYLAVVDCTGHGVPGAFVSIIGYTGLNRCLNEFNLEQPAQILDKLTDIVLETFQKGEHDVMDGMDISLLRIDPTGEVQFAGANNSLYIVSEILENEEAGSEPDDKTTITWLHNKRQIRQIKADRQPVGEFLTRKAFTNHTLFPKSGDMLYLFSDGYADQFGGPKNKKFTYKRLREKFVLISTKPMETQKEHLEATFSNWKKEEEQLDDICIIGFKFDTFKD